MSIIITHEVIKEALSYPAYVELAGHLIENRQTTGIYHSDDSVSKSAQNLLIIQDLLETITIQEQVIKILQVYQVPLTWLAITESWCIDSANSLPVIYKMSQVNANIQLKVILRDSSSIIDNFTTRGSRSIPKVICLDAESLVVLGVWGPRPAELEAKIMVKVKHLNNAPNNDEIKRREKIRSIIKSWYNENQAQSIQQEVLESLIP